MAYDLSTRLPTMVTIVHNFQVFLLGTIKFYCLVAAQVMSSCSCAACSADWHGHNANYNSVMKCCKVATISLYTHKSSTPMAAPI